MNKLAEKKFKKAVIAVFFGKAIKMAQGVEHTHAAKSSLSLQKLSEWMAAYGNEELAAKIAGANTARHAFEYFPCHYFPFSLHFLS